MDLRDEFSVGSETPTSRFESEYEPSARQPMTGRRHRPRPTSPYHTHDTLPSPLDLVRVLRFRMASAPSPSKARDHLISGGASGLASSVALQPLDLLKTRIQQEGGTSKSVPALSVLTLLSRIPRHAKMARLTNLLRPLWIRVPVSFSTPASSSTSRSGPLKERSGMSLEESSVKMECWVSGEEQRLRSFGSSLLFRPRRPKLEG